MFTFTHKESMVTPDGPVDGSTPITGELRVPFSASAPVATTEYAVPIDVSAVKAIVIKSSKNVTLKTNSSSTPDNTIVLVADVPYMWSVGRGTLALTVDVVSIFVVNASDGAADVLIQALVDATP